MDVASLRRAAAWRLQVVPRRLSALKSRTRLVQEDLQLVSTVGYQLAARITRPANAGPLPGVVISPAIHQGIDVLETMRAPVTPQEIARLGYVVLTFDPAGRGKSWGEEDYGGPEHQDDLRVAIRHLLKTDGVNGQVGVLALSLGIAAAVGALATWPDELPVRWLLDWEGPCDREIITSGGTIMVPANGHALDDEGYWRPREAVRRVAQLRCGYVRIQADPDHAQPGEVRHAERMMHAAQAAQGKGLPWFQLNDHARNTLPPRPDWAPGGPFAANQTLLRKLKALKAG